MSNPLIAPQVLIVCLDCSCSGTNIGEDMQCKNCLSYNTRRFIETEPVMDEVAWHNFGYAWAKWRGINWYHAMGDIEDSRRKFGDSITLQMYVEGMARAHLTKHAPDVVESVASVSISTASEVSASEADSSPATTQVM